MARTYSQLPRVSFSILLALSLKPRHGYEIIKQVKEDSGGRIKLSPGALYASIKQLNEHRLIEEIDEPTDSRRRYYRLTPQGKKMLNTELEYYKNTVELGRKRQILSIETFYG
ncbi:MAG: PadR family transcriptional regulator [Nitrosotalea sp.]